MEDLFDSLYNKYVLSKSSILSHIDEYTLVCHYLGYNPTINQTYISPLRGDDTNESFSFYYPNGSNSLRYRDFGTGDGGDVFRLIGKLYNLELQGVLELIDQDFDLGYSSGKGRKDVKIIKHTPIVKPKLELRVRSHKGFSKEALAYWKEYCITERILQMYNVTEVKYLHYGNHVITPRGLCFAYQIGNYYKIYQPYSSTYKFRNNFPSRYVEGYIQLLDRNFSKSDTLIITKSTKDVMCLRVLGFDSISPKGENTPIPKNILLKIEEMYKKIFILFDNDSAGKLGADRYGYKQIFLVKAKDVSDHIQKYGVNDTRYELTKLLYS